MKHTRMIKDNLPLYNFQSTYICTAPFSAEGNTSFEDYGMYIGGGAI